MPSGLIVDVVLRIRPEAYEANYEKLATAYFDDARTLDDAAKIEDKAQTRAALGKLGASCKTCHTAHKGK